jgi:sterol desaturase/sphingolipid hydroxylase (fatty acid hydroxylase superfamily)
MELAAAVNSWQPRTAVILLMLLFAWETLQPYIALFARGGEGWARRGRHALINLVIGIVNALITGLLFAAIWLATTVWAAEHQVGLLHWTTLPTWADWILAVLLLDLWTYTWHRLNHVVPFFWRFHKLHHSDRAMDVTTASRFHFLEITFSSVLRVPILLLVGCSIEQLAVYELVMFGVVQFHHANIGLSPSLDRALRAVIVTPNMHKVHHSVVRAECDSNFSSLFSWWDRLFRTLRLSRNPKAIRFGVDP